SHLKMNLQTMQDMIGHHIPEVNACQTMGAFYDWAEKNYAGHPGFNQIKANIQVLWSILRQQRQDQYWNLCISKVSETDPTWCLSAKTAEDFFVHPVFMYGVTDPFQQAFGGLFVTYRSNKHKNDILEKNPDTTGQQRVLSEDKFRQRYGSPPWEFVNRILQECELDFRVDSPPMHETGPYEPKLTKLSKAVEMRFGDLSSGEKVLMSFALCLYNAQTEQQTIFPKLLLLDEVDAPLHPSMTKSLLNTIQNVLVKEKEIVVIMTTHSPSTVALAPEEAIYAMNPEGPKLEKVSKNHALSLLTTGVPTLSVSFDGRRQVFVESKNDAELYELLYQKYKDHLGSECSLTFIEVGNKTESGGEQNAGCKQVKRIVEGLVAAGNQSVFGLIDWDGKNTSDTGTRIHVLSANRRNGLENALFDPVLIFATVVRENIAEARKHFPTITIKDYESTTHWTVENWQAAVDALQQFMEFEPASNSLKIQYLNGMSLQITQAYLHTDDHKLDALIVEKFAYLQPKNKHAGDLMRHIVNTVLTDKPNLLPQDILDTFQQLLEA
ncbi:MAG: AAA family ATPase, partial [Methylophilaceae bacterium]|nr:AAA family ATPase [Methylophilaceae bacterium]